MLKVKDVLPLNNVHVLLLLSNRMYHYCRIVYFYVTEAITNVKMVDVASTLTVYSKDAKARVAGKNKASDHEICDLDDRVKSVKHKCKRNLFDSDSD